MRRFLLGFLLLCLPSLSPASGPAASSGVKGWVGPMVGWTPPGQTLGVAANLSSGRLMGSGRHLAASEFCVPCDDWAESRQTQLLAGGKLEFRAGYLSLLTGAAWESGRTRDRFGAHPYDGFALPLAADLGITGRWIGVNLTLSYTFSADNPGAGIFMGLPIGRIR